MGRAPVSHDCASPNAISAQLSSRSEINLRAPSPTQRRLARHTGPPSSLRHSELTAPHQANSAVSRVRINRHLVVNVTSATEPRQSLIDQLSRKCDNPAAAADETPRQMLTALTRPQPLDKTTKRADTIAAAALTRAHPPSLSDTPSPVIAARQAATKPPDHDQSRPLDSPFLRRAAP